MSPSESFPRWQLKATRKWAQSPSESSAPGNLGG